MKNCFWLFYVLMLLPACLFGQGEAANWVTNVGTFRFDANGLLQYSALPKNVKTGFLGLQQNPLPVVNSCDGKILFFESDSSLSRSLIDSAGNRLFNGNLSIGNNSKPAIIEKISLNEDLYLMFADSGSILSSGNLFSSTLFYTKIEKSQANNEYTVTARNALPDQITGGLTVVPHSNGMDKWLIFVNRLINTYHVYLIDTSANLTPHSTFTDARFNHNQANHERLYASPDGTKLVTCNFRNSQIEFLKFNPATGMLDSLVILPPILNGLQVVPNPYFCFSPRGTKLYAWMSITPIFQYDVTTWDSMAIRSSSQRILNAVSQFASLTLAVDGKIYIYGITNAAPFRLNFSRINEPDLPYPLNGFQDTVVFLPASLPPQAFQQHMPRFPMRYFYPGRFSVVANDVCLGDTARMRLYDYDNLNSVRWDFGDPISPNNTDTVFAPVHYYSQPGTYTITAIADYCNKLDTLTKTIRVWGFPESPNLPDTVLCTGSSLPLSLPADSTLTYRWSTGDSTRNTQLNTGGWHWVELSNPCFTTRDSFYVTLHEPPQSGLVTDTNMCEGNSLTLTPQPGNYTWQWQDGSTQPLTVTAAGTYALLMTNACGTFTHQVRVDYQQAPSLSLNDTSRCEGQFLRVELPETWQTNYQWADGSNERIRVLTDSGWYSAQISNPCGTASDDFYLTLTDCRCHVYLPTAFSPNADGTNDQLLIKTRCALSSYQMEVYDRWGKLVFVSNNLNRGWDGTYQGQDLPPGSYAFVIRYTPEGRDARVEKGVVTLLR